MINIDLHIHSIASGHAFNTIDEIIDYATIKEYLLVGIADHGPNMEGAPHEGYFEMMPRLPKEKGRIKIMYGCEANIINSSGSIDLSDKTIECLDYVIAGLHNRTIYNTNSIENNTQAIVNAISSGKVNIISHPVSLNFPINVTDVVEAALRHNVILELNKTILLNALKGEYIKTIDDYRLLIEMSLKKGVKLIFGSDAHHISEMGISMDQMGLLEYHYGIDFKRLLNHDIENLKNYIKER